MRQWIRVFFSLSILPMLLMGGVLAISTQKHKYKSGDKVLFFEDFKSCPVGEIPEGLDKFTGTVECVRYQNHIWIAPSFRCTEDHESAIYKKLYIGHREFSIEFDTIALKNHAHVMLRLLKKKGSQWDRDRFFLDLYYHGIDWDKSCSVNLEKVGNIAKIQHCPEKKTHIAIQVRRGQYRVYINGKRAMMKPMPAGDVSGFEIRFPADTDKYGILISNIKVAEYAKKEAKPTPEKLGITVKKTKEGMKLTVPEKVLFDFNRFVIKPNAKVALSVVGEIIRENLVKKIVVTGYTDNVGSDAYNLKLSLQRAQSVADYLTYCEKIDPKLFKIVGKGEAAPIASNATKEGRTKNRRVEIQLLK